MHQGLVVSFLGMNVSAFFPSEGPQQFSPTGLGIEPKTGVALYYNRLALSVQSISFFSVLLMQNLIL